MLCHIAAPEESRKREKKSQEMAREKQALLEGLSAKEKENPKRKI